MRLSEVLNTWLSVLKALTVDYTVDLNKNVFGGNG